MLYFYLQQNLRRLLTVNFEVVVERPVLSIIIFKSLCRVYECYIFGRTLKTLLSLIFYSLRDRPTGGRASWRVYPDGRFVGLRWDERLGCTRRTAVVLPVRMLSIIPLLVEWELDVWYHNSSHVIYFILRVAYPTWRTWRMYAYICVYVCARLQHNFT